MDQTISSSELISQIQSTINKVKEINDNDQVIQAVSNTLILPFKNQLQLFLKDRILQTSIIDDQQKWKSFLSNLLEMLEITPVLIMKKQKKKDRHAENLKNDPLKPGMWINKISIIKSDLGDFNAEEKFCLEITTSDTTKIIIPFTPVWLVT